MVQEIKFVLDTHINEIGRVGDSIVYFCINYFFCSFLFTFFIVLPKTNHKLELKTKSM